MTKQLSTYNLLFIGDSSVDKSTLINAFANYLHFGEFYKAVASEMLIQLVPSVGTTTLIHPETFENFVIRDEDELESEEADGEMQNYLIKYQDKIIRIFNSPDFDEADQIEEKMGIVIEYLQRFDKLHAICCFVKADSTDEQIKLFKAIFSELICNFSKSALSNLIFCFNYNQNSFNGVGENGHQNLKQLISENLGQFEIELKISENCFYLENDVYKFLRAKNRGFPCTKTGLDFYEENWNRSSERLKKLLDQIIFNVEPHNLNKSFILSKAQKWIIHMEKPLSKLEQKIDEYLAQIQQETHLLQNSSRNKSNFVKITNGIQSSLDKVKVCQNELYLIEGLTSNLLEFIVLNSCTDYTALLEPQLDRLIQANTGISSKEKLQLFVETAKEENKDNSQLCREIMIQSSKLTTLKISGEFFANNLANLNELANSSKFSNAIISIVDLIGPILNSIIFLNEKIKQSKKLISARIAQNNTRTVNINTYHIKQLNNQSLDAKTRFSILIANEDGKISYNKRLIEFYENSIKEHQNEMKIISEISTQFGYFLLSNCNLSFQHNQNEVLKPLFNDVRVSKFLEEHCENVLSFVEERPKISVELIEEFRKKLTSLKHTGSKFAQTAKINA